MEKFESPQNFSPESLAAQARHGVLWTAGFESPRRIITPSGQVALGTERGGREGNEDMMVLHLAREAFAVVDGMGGYEHGDIAARLVAEAIKDDFNQPVADPTAIQFQAHRRMREQNIGVGGAVYLAARIEEHGRKLLAYGAGDAQLLVVDRRGNIKYTSDATPLDQAPSGRGPGRPTMMAEMVLENYDLIIAATDGLWNNATVEDVARVTAHQPVERVLAQVAALGVAGMTGERGDGSFGNPDNISVIVYQILPVPLRGK